MVTDDYVNDDDDDDGDDDDDDYDDGGDDDNDDDDDRVFVCLWLVACRLTSVGGLCAHY